MNSTVFFKIGYGLYVLSAREGQKDNACIINTLAQVTSSPARVTICVNKQNYTHDMIQRTGVFNASILSEKAQFRTFQRFGFQSGRTSEKFYGTEGQAERVGNGLYIWKDGANSWLSGKVIDTIDLGTHTLFVADVTDGEILDPGTDSATYSFYHKNIKPAPPKKEETPAAPGKYRFRCKICGYIYESDTDTLPPDFVCPLCKHGAEDFERI
ncbi:MAG: flavin reductase [Thermoguttaceae bacterium]|nr:flavin reductase [Thermoguttaceae bacterium]